MKRIKRFLSNWWVLSLLIAVAVALVVTIGLPPFVGFFRPLWIRVVCVVLIAAVWAGIAAWRVIRARRAADAIAAELAPPSAADAEGKALADRMAQALVTLRTAAGKRRAYLYTKPWYVIIGPPGAGKTTALVNSGLRFPVGEQALAGVGGTRNLDFWFADEAALVDTAGRYTTQDSDQTVDARGWTSFLSLLKKHRPFQPINGVIVAIGVDELVGGDRATIDGHARAVRQRLIELRRTLAVAAPVYILLTKADLLAGFVEYYDDLDVEGRRAVLGATLPWTGATPDSQALAHAYDAMAQGIADRQAKRLFEEVDAARRSAVLGFPAQIDLLRPRLMRLLDGVFTPGEEQGGVLRGFYLTSGVQQGTPFDRIMSGVAEVYDRPGASAGDGARSGRAYFLNRLLGDVMFPEAGLVMFDPAARRRQRLQLAGVLGGIGAATLLILIGWSVSFAQNRKFEADLEAGAAVAAREAQQSGVDMQEVSGSDPDLRAALPLLNTLRDLPRGYAVRQNGAPPLMMTLGLYQQGLSLKADGAYRDALRRILLPRLLLRLEEIMRASGNDATALYEPLKTYLMLGGQGPLDRGSIRAFVARDWADNIFPGSDAEVERTQMEQHLQALLTDPDLSAAWTGRQAPLDGALVVSARTAIQTLNLADRAYAVLKQKAGGAGQPWEAADVLSAGDAQAFADPDKVIDARVPFFFTRAGYDRAYTLGLAKVQEDLRRDLWVLGTDPNRSGLKLEMGNVRPGVAARYAQDYIAAWEAFLALLKPGAYFSDPQALAAFTKTPSPLKRLLLEVTKNTTFSGGARNMASRSGERMLRKQLMRQRSLRKFGLNAQDFAGGGKAPGAGDLIADHFEGIQGYAGKENAAGPVDAFVDSVKEAGEAVIAARATGGGGAADATQAAMASAMAKVATAAAGTPDQLKTFAQDAAKGGGTAQTAATSGAVEQAYQQAVLPACRAATQDHYPFLAASLENAPVPEMLRVFGMGGVVDGFAQTRLAALIDTSGPVWRWKADQPVTANLDPQSPEQFANAAQIRDLLAGGLPLHVSAVAWGSDVKDVQFASGGATYRFARDTVEERPVQWSVNSSVPEAEVVVTGTTGDKPIARFAAEGPWALFRLMDQASKENSGPQAFKATFGDGSRSVTLLVKLPSERNPFSRGGVWSFRCPTTL